MRTETSLKAAAETARPNPSSEQKTGAEAESVAGAAKREPTEGYWVVERPSEGLAQGQYAWPAWGIMTVGGLTVVAGLVYLLVRFRSARASQ